jgi:hypothetical protein
MGRLSTINASDYRLLDDYPTIDYWSVSVFLPVVRHGLEDALDPVMFRSSVFVAQCRSPGVSLSEWLDV